MTVSSDCLYVFFRDAGHQSCLPWDKIYHVICLPGIYDHVSFLLGISDHAGFLLGIIDNTYCLSGTCEQSTKDLRSCQLHIYLG
jgi:hypothetical protein